jgi:hypothetical protein
MPTLRRHTEVIADLVKRLHELACEQLEDASTGILGDVIPERVSAADTLNAAADVIAALAASPSDAEVEAAHALWYEGFAMDPAGTRIKRALLDFLESRLP